MMQDKAEYARKGIARGKSIIVLEYADGILLVAENPSATLNKISEIYDRIAFAGAGRYSEFENLRKAGIRYADVKGFAYDRADVTAKSLANAYSQTIGNIFSEAMKPLEVEILVVEVANGASANELYRITFDGSIGDEKGFAAIGGQADELRQYLKDTYQTGLDQKAALRLATRALEAVNNAKIEPRSLEVAVLERSRAGRKFRRLSQDDLASMLTDTE
ncbi:MAG: proteasome subunit alpha [Candidatus Methylomirabilota bacterium]|nr:MAG: proteasome subunit alpha [candidate division NC10 bacterium]